MSDWTSGYVADIGYTFGYYQELNPLRVKLAFLNAGLVCPEFGNACELGFGQGVSANIHAAASICSWYGTDFIPEQASFAQELASASGANAHLYDESFAEFAQRDLPEFDYIGLHGIWSWISDENRQIIIDFVKRRLKVGGVLYISYNSLPGWGPLMPLRHLMIEHSEVLGSRGEGILSRIEKSLDFVKKVVQSSPQLISENPYLIEKIQKIEKGNKHYAAHEYFNKNLVPMHFDEVADLLSTAKLTYACPAKYWDHIDSINLSLNQIGLIEKITDKNFKESVRDYMVNQQFRRDYWVKGARKLTAFEQVNGYRNLRFILMKHVPSINLKIEGALGEASLNEKVYKPLLDLMSDYKIRSFKEIESELKTNGIDFLKLAQALLVLAGNSTISCVQDEKIIQTVKERTDKFNSYVLEKAKGSAEINYLASPVTGGAIKVSRFPMLFISAIQQGLAKPLEWANFVEKILRAQNQKIVMNDKTLETKAEMLAELEKMANDFSSKLMPILKALQII